MDADRLLELTYLRRLVNPAETHAEALAGVRADLAARAPRAPTPAELAAQVKAREDSDKVDAWLRTKPGRGSLAKPYAEQLADFRAAAGA